MTYEVPRPNEAYVTRGKTIAQLIKELKTFDNQNLEARISLDGGQTHHPISILSRKLDDMNGNGHICIIEFESEA